MARPLTTGARAVATPNGAAAAAPRPARPSARVNARLLVVALLLGLLVAAGVLKALSVAAQRSPVLVVRRDVPAGTTITDDMVDTVAVASDVDVGALPARDRARVVGLTARHRLVAGELLRTSDVATEPPVGADERRVGLRLERGRFPFDLEAGTAVRVVTEQTTSYPAVVARFVKSDDGSADIVVVVPDAQADALARDVQAGKAVLVAEAAR